MTARTPPAKKPPEDKVLALRSALRAAPKKRAATPRSPLKAAVAQLRSDLLAFRAKGYSGAELAEVMREHGFEISARTLMKYMAEFAPRRPVKKKKPPPAPTARETKAASAPAPTPRVTQRAEPARASLLIAAPPSMPMRRRQASDVLGHRFDEDV
ncbi:hypothetical protein [Methylocystis heyeri]|uniref:Uncharacterized protein n=1 Tax=Methylocystis heyeri TaxID=391905 RepID=A0A6B8KDN6_9HYPH|nr:hypothetical protein [Methylocystis heyeri]QGM45712.1 hypothetical protein H2LOC_008365 [Methylocystis heyeri]